MSTLADRAAIQRLIPHQGSMCLLDAVLEWDATRIVCISQSHKATDNPLRLHGHLSPLALIEYGAQAMAIHAALLAKTSGKTVERRLLVSTQAVSFDCDSSWERAHSLIIHAQQRLSDTNGALYNFEIFSENLRCVWGRVGVLREIETREISKY